MTNFHSVLGKGSAPCSDLAHSIFGHPDEVLMDHRLSVQDKRTLLASWASDANAVANLPSLRQLPDGSIVPVDDILRSLKALDSHGDIPKRKDATGPFWLRSIPRRSSWSLNDWRGKHFGPNDDDDDPPPCPAAAARRPRNGDGGAFALPEAAAA